MQSKTIDRFLGVFAHATGNEVISPFSIVPPKEHERIKFTNSSIVPLLWTYLEHKKDVLVCQPCIRLRKDKEDVIPKLPYFKMLGGIFSPDKLHVLVQTLADYFSQIGIEDSNSISLYVSSKDKEMLEEAEQSFNLKVDKAKEDFDRDEDTFYDWRDFGIDGISGRACRIHLRQKDGRFYDVGQLMKIKDESGEILAYALGIGVEALIYRQNGLPRFRNASIVNQVVDEKIQEKAFLEFFVSSIGTIQTVSGIGLSADGRKSSSAQSILRKLYRECNYVARFLNWDTSAIINAFQLFSDNDLSLVGLSSDLPAIKSNMELVGTDIRDNRKKVENYTDELLRQKVAPELLTRKVVARGTTDFAILKQEIDEVLTSRGISIPSELGSNYGSTISLVPNQKFIGSR
jgi:hypothetical protein